MASVGGGPPLACGAAMALQRTGGNHVAVAFVGDGGSNQGTTFESMNLAMMWNLPAIIVVEDNGYAEATSSNYTVASGSNADRARGFGLPSESVDGHDFFAVYEAAGKAISRAREGGGPSLIVLTPSDSPAVPHPDATLTSTTRTPFSQNLRVIITSPCPV